MTEISQVGGNTAGTREPRTTVAGYRTAQDAAARAAAFKSEDDGKTRAAIDRLAGMLGSQTEPRRDVPRGYYLDISV